MRRVMACGMVVGLAAAWATADGGRHGLADAVRLQHDGKRDRSASGVQFAAFPQGMQEVPPVDSITHGMFGIRFNRDMTAASFDVKVFDGTEITQAHLHCAPEGVNGPVVVFLSGFIPGGFDVHGRLASFTLTDANVAAVAANCVPTTGMEILNLSDLAAAAAEGLIYVNVHSIANPSGEIRGQLLPVGDDHADDGYDDEGDDD